MDPVEAVRSRLAERRVPGAGPLVHEEVLGVADQLAAAQLLVGAVAEHGGTAVSSVEFLAVSVGVVLGCRLDDGRGVVLKAFRPSVARRAIEAGQHAQHLALEAGLAAPRPLAPPFDLGTGLATLESLLLDGERGDVRPPPVRLNLAGGLQRLVAVLAPMRSDPGLDRPDRALLTAEGSPYAAPHSSLFDFDATADGAAWIDDAAWEALDVLGSALSDRSAVVHSDWRAENVRMGPGGVAAVYDWDSLQAGDEAALVGGVARAFSTDWTQSDPMIPTVADMLGFVDDYQSCRPAPFSPDEKRRMRAGIVHALAYSARCEHALGDRATWAWGFRSLLTEFLHVG